MANIRANGKLADLLNEMKFVPEKLNDSFIQFHEPSFYFIYI